MAALLNKFRINYADLVVITDLNKPQKESTKTWFDGLVRPFIRREELTGTLAFVLHLSTKFLL
jgi:solute carrier family 12 sodium/potassium/chloride transporter 2